MWLKDRAFQSTDVNYLQATIRKVFSLRWMEFTSQRSLLLKDDIGKEGTESRRISGIPEA